MSASASVGHRTPSRAHSDESRATMERAGLRVLAWHEATQEALEQAVSSAEARDSGSLPPLGLHILMGPESPAISRNMLRNLQERRLTLLNAVLAADK